VLGAYGRNIIQTGVRQNTDSLWRTGYVTIKPEDVRTLRVFNKIMPQKVSASNSLLLNSLQTTGIKPYHLIPPPPELISIMRGFRVISNTNTISRNPKIS
jgi:hypothetical protein